MWLRLQLLLLLCLTVRGIYDSENHIEHARLYGNIDSYAYYYVDLVIGTPAQRVSVILDTGSGVCAFPCASCTHCGQHIDPAFDVAKSSSASWLQCQGGRCPAGRCQGDKCSYYQGYTEGSSISGFWFEDKVALGDTIQLNPMVNARMGCHSNENNLFYTQKANGIFGIGPSGLQGNAVLEKVFQDHEHISGKVFSICLAEWGGRWNIGGFDKSYHTTPIKYIGLRASGFYSVFLSEMKVDGKSVSKTFGSTMIDSGTTYTYMRTSSYNALKGAIEGYCKSHDCGGTRQGACWDLPNGPGKLPKIEVIFGGVVTYWVPRAYLYRRIGTNSYCYGFENDGANANTVLGATWMVHQDVIFDMVENRVGVASANCPEHKERPSPGATQVQPPTTVLVPTTTLPVTTTLPPTATLPETTTLPPTTTLPGTTLPHIATTLPPTTTLLPTTFPPTTRTTALMPATSSLTTLPPVTRPPPTTTFAPAITSTVYPSPTSAPNPAVPQNVQGVLELSVSGDCTVFANDPSSNAAVVTGISSAAAVPASYVTIVNIHCGRRLAGTRRLATHMVLAEYSIRIPITDSLAASMVVSRINAAPQSKIAQLISQGGSMTVTVTKLYASDASSTSPSKAFDPLSWLGQDPVRLAGAATVALLSACLFICLTSRLCSKFRGKQHRHIQLKDEDEKLAESGMPPQIVGSAGVDTAGLDVFAIGDDDENDHLSESFEYVDDVVLPSHGTAMSGLRLSGTSNGQDHDLLDLGFGGGGQSSDRRANSNGFSAPPTFNGRSSGLDMGAGPLD